MFDPKCRPETAVDLETIELSKSYARPIGRRDQSLMSPKAFAIAGRVSGVGKTTVTIGAVAALRRRGLVSWCGADGRWDVTVRRTAS
jgi:Mrp family chromosome partitioning ATPase